MSDMKKLLPLAMLLMAAPANADLITKHSTSVQLTVDAAASQATRLGSSYSVSGSNVSATLGGLTAPASASAAATMNSGTYSQTTDGSAFSFTETFNQGDAIPTGTTVSSGVAASLPAFGSVTTTSGGVAGSLGGSIDSAGTMSLTAGGAGTSATGQFVAEITIR
ncbi:hypothetical cyanophage protein [Synechococcus phage S-RSM4]|uniref:Hypothetical cyanophage protein n=2 Tax=root TaxID=1 RepID=C7BUZ7_9CAUD|nr:hypothetical cyanophage protein [Synechococcus phage S-RSM4]CAR63226.1 hypothetical cyanophage protein [Synechococcus phage S-RSM4]